MTEVDPHRDEYDRYYDEADKIPGRRPMTFDEWKAAKGIAPAPREPKGQRFGGPCNTTACQKPGATYWNTSTRAYYCAKCARGINEYCPGAPLCIQADSMPGFSTADRHERLIEAARALEKVLPDGPEWYGAAEAKAFRAALKGV